MLQESSDESTTTVYSTYFYVKPMHDYDLSISTDEIIERLNDA